MEEVSRARRSCRNIPTLSSGGQLVFAKETVMKRLFHNYTVFALQSMFYHKGIPFVILAYPRAVAIPGQRNVLDKDSLLL